MKTLLTIITLNLAMLFVAHTAQASSINNFCLSMADLGEASVKAKNTGVPYSLAVKTTKAQDGFYDLPTKHRTLLLDIVRIGYDTNIRPKAFGDQVYLICLSNV